MRGEPNRETTRADGSGSAKDAPGRLSLWRSDVPWWAKISIKIVASRLPLSYCAWRRLGLFRHGEMLSPDYAIGVYRSHYDSVRAHLPQRYSVLELGPGDSLATAPIAHAYGAGTIWLADVGPFASADVAAYRPLLERLHVSGPGGGGFATVSAMLEAMGATYLTSGLDALRTVPDESVDFVFSNAVLEHVALEQFDDTIQELYRIQKRGGLASHEVDFRDHLANSLHSLRFSRRWWESALFSRSGFYTNRLRIGDVIRAFSRAGYEVVSRTDTRWPTLPLSRRHMDAEFRSFPDDELLACISRIVLRKP